MRSHLAGVRKTSENECVTCGGIMDSEQNQDGVPPAAAALAMNAAQSDGETVSPAGAHRRGQAIFICGVRHA